MTHEALKLHHSLRVARANDIMAKPDEFKVCNQCLSIAFKRAGICPICHAYRFNESPAAVAMVAQYTTTTAFPITSGTVPRI